MKDVDDPLLLHLQTLYGDTANCYGKPSVQVLMDSPMGCAVFRIEPGEKAPRTRFVRAGDAVGVFQADMIIDQPELFIELFALKRMAYDSAFKEAE